MMIRNERTSRLKSILQGGSCDDFLTHLMCCCCAMVQEWRALELRGFVGKCNLF